MTEPVTVFTANCGCRYRLQTETAVLRGAVLALIEMCKSHAEYREAHIVEAVEELGEAFSGVSRP